MFPVVIGTACTQRPFDSEMLLGGKVVDAQVLNAGHGVYRRFCVGCHGIDGKSNTDAAAASNPRPRDLTQGTFKFSSVPSPQLPTDEDLVRIVRRGLAGTAMPAFTGLTDPEVHSVVQYIKTFSSRWQAERQGIPVRMYADPFLPSRQHEAVSQGQMLYHGIGKCWPCHPAYLSRDERESVADEYRKSPLYPDAYDADGGVVGTPRSSDETKFAQMLPPDFLSDNFRAGKRVEDIYRTVAAGVGGTRMYPVFDKFSAEDLWAIAHYVGYLAHIAGTPEAAAIQQQSDHRR